MTIKKPSSLSHYLSAASYRQRASVTQLFHITRRSPWLQATTCCKERTTAAPGESYSFTLALLLELARGIALQVSPQVCKKMGEISHF